MEDEVAHTYSLAILTPEKTIFQGQVYSLIVLGVEGYFEVLAQHTPLIAVIQPGKLVVMDKNQQKLIYAVSTGLLEVSQNQAALLIDAIEPIAAIDLPRAQAAYERAHARLMVHAKETDLLRAKQALQRAENRIKLSI